jgi:hypothetical protein
MYVILGLAALIVYEVPRLLKSRCLRETLTVVGIVAATLYYSVCFALDLPEWSMFSWLMHLFTIP